MAMLVGLSGVFDGLLVEGRDLRDMDLLDGSRARAVNAS